MLQKLDSQTLEALNDGINLINRN